MSIDTSFKSLIQKNIREVVVVDPKPWMEDKKFTLVDSIEQLESVVDEAIEAGHCAVDLETTGLDNRIKPNGKTVDDIVGYCLSFDGEEGFYVPVKHRCGDGSFYNVCLREQEVADVIERLVNNCVTIYHNSPFDHEFLYGLGIEIDSHKMFEDTLILDYLRDSSYKRHGLKHLSEKFLGMEMIELSEIFPEEAKDLDFSKLDPSDDKVLWYAGSDAICTYLLFEFYKNHASKPVSIDRSQYLDDEEIEKRKEKGDQTIFEPVPVDNVEDSIFKEQKFPYLIEKINVPALRWMERNRPKIDVDYLERVIFEVENLIENVKQEISEGFSNYGYTLKPEHVSSTQKLSAAFEHLIEENYIKKKLQRTEGTGQVKTSDDAIEDIAEDYGDKFPFIEKITVFRRLQKILGTYLEPFRDNTAKPGDPGPIDDFTTRFSFQPCRVDTGRYSASGGRPNHGYSGVNIQSAPAGYNKGKFSAKKIISRPEGSGVEDAKLYENFEDAKEGDFLIRVYDGHFVKDPREDQEYCVRESCEGCPFEKECERTNIPEWDDEQTDISEDGYYKRNTAIMSLDASLRPAIKARDGYVISPVDFSGVEMRVAANVSKEPKWIKEFKEGDGDLHTLTAQIVYGDDVVNKPDFKMYRQQGKAANFSILYGGSGSAVARATGVSREEGRHIRKKWLSGLPKLKKWFDDIKRRVKRNKQVTTSCGRKIRLPDIDHKKGFIKAKAERNAINSIIQGTATGDLTKYCMGRVYKEFKEEGLLDDCRMILTIHDELVFEIKKDKLDELVPKIREIMTELGDHLNWIVPLEVDFEIGDTFNAIWDWDKMHTIDSDANKAKEPVPQSLLGHVELEPGMWYYDEDGCEVVIEGLELEEDEDKSDDDSDVSSESESQETEKQENEEEEIKYNEQLRGIYMDLKKTRTGETKTSKEGPTFVYKLKKSPLVKNGDDDSAINDLMRRLYKILDFFAVEVESHHKLKVLDWEGNRVISENEGILVNPDIFRILAAYEGIDGQVIE